jgi:hypothetical protein
VQPSRSHPSGRTSLALALSAGYLVVAGAFGTILLTTGSKETGSATPVIQTTIEPAWETTTTTSAPPSRSRTTTSSSAPAGYRRVLTQAGMTTMIPEGWPVVPCSSGNGCEQATDPVDTERFLRFGASPSPSASLESTQSTYERQFSQRSGYRQIRFETGSYHGFPSVEWEFEWTSSGVRRHVRVMYWRADGNDNIAYASSTANRWDQTLPLYQNMISYSTP